MCQDEIAISDDADVTTKTWLLSETWQIRAFMSDLLT